MKYAIVAFGSKQYKVQKGSIIDVDLLPDMKKSATSDNVLLVVDGDKVLVGTPNVKGAMVKYSLSEIVKGDKIKVFRYKAKSRYRRTSGHRQEYSRIKIDDITVK